MDFNGALVLGGGICCMPRKEENSSAPVFVVALPSAPAGFAAWFPQRFAPVAWDDLAPAVARYVHLDCIEAAFRARGLLP